MSDKIKLQQHKVGEERISENKKFLIRVYDKNEKRISQEVIETGSLEEARRIALDQLNVTVSEVEG